MTATPVLPGTGTLPGGRHDPARPGAGQVGAVSRPAAADVALWAVLTGPEVPARVVAVTPAACYLQLLPEGGPGAGVLAVLTLDAVRVPSALVLPVPAAAGPFTAVRRDASAVCGLGGVALPGMVLRVHRWWEAPAARCRPAAGPEDVDRLRSALAALEPALPALPGLLRAPSSRLDRALRTASVDGDLAPAVAGLVGLGPGMTPAGDDVLAGVLVALSATGDAARASLLAQAVTRQLSRTTTVSAALLREAARGRAVPQLARFVAGAAGLPAPGGGTRPRWVQDLLQVGASSGTALAHGALLGLRTASDRCSPDVLEVS